MGEIAKLRSRIEALEEENADQRRELDLARRQVKKLTDEKDKLATDAERQDRLCERMMEGRAT